MPPPGLLNGLCRGMAPKGASIGGLVDDTLISPPTPHGDDTGSSFRSVSTSSTSDYELPLIISVLAANLDYLIARNEQELPTSKRNSLTAPPNVCNGHTDRELKLTLFHGLRPPAIGVHKYLERIYRYTNCSPSCFVVAYAFMDRFVHHQPDQPIISLNVHRLLITSVMLAAKTLDDIHYNNAFYARVGGVSIEELNRMELELLFRLDFRLCVTTHTFNSYCVHLEHEFRNLGNKVLNKGIPICRKSEDSANTKDSHNPWY
ncbi:hypothetical protein KP509_04G109700 [Ceratopteris richardii]|uniref:Cyclin n=1 Tax=Ceratopteris richardii TaxID=49495 RepID=A0A8T2UW57_CERRI|nr:hypothetical protein KP509_04G109700 [Ceratopteris richardii]KAH7440481.1 hypothetical protein KP509_04G109700 [Ceratopteris richardii]